MRPLVLIILICLAPLIVLAEQPDATTQVSPEYSEETDKSEALDSTIEQLKQELEQVNQQLKSIGETQEQLELDRQKLGRIVIDNNELFTLKVMRDIAIACESFRLNQRLKSYPRRFEELKDYTSEGIMNATRPSKAIFGYYYKYRCVNKDSFRLKAIPATKGKTGERTFVLDNTDVIIDEETGKPVSSKKRQSQKDEGEIE